MMADPVIYVEYFGAYHKVIRFESENECDFKTKNPG